MLSCLLMQATTSCPFSNICLIHLKLKMLIKSITSPRRRLFQKVAALLVGSSDNLPCLLVFMPLFIIISTLFFSILPFQPYLSARKKPHSLLTFVLLAKQTNSFSSLRMEVSSSTDHPKLATLPVLILNCIAMEKVSNLMVWMNSSHSSNSIIVAVMPGKNTYCSGCL